MRCAADNHNYMCHIYRKGFLIQSLIKQLLTKDQILMKLPQISHIHKNRNVVYMYDWNFLKQLLLPYKFYGRDK